MKINQEHYIHLLNTISNIGHIIPALRTTLANDSKVKDVEKRLRWDLSYKAGLTPYICDNLYSYLNDDHIDTALKAVVKELESRY